jgi:hypothetical protein
MIDQSALCALVLFVSPITTLPDLHQAFGFGQGPCFSGNDCDR